MIVMALGCGGLRGLIGEKFVSGYARNLTIMWVVSVVLAMWHG